MIDEPTATDAAGPALPSDADIRRDILSRDILDMPTGAKPRKRLDRSKFSEAELERLREAKRTLGPGHHADAYDIALWEQYSRVQENIAAIKKLEADYNAVDSYDPASGQPVYAFSEPRREAMRKEAVSRNSEIERIYGEPGRRTLEKALEKAVEQEKMRRVRSHVEAEAARLADKMRLDKRIQRRALAILRASGELDEEE